MQRLLTSAAAATLLMAAAGAAQAQDWAGPYIGGSLGYVSTDSDGNESIQFDTNLNGQYGDTVNTTAPANAFSPGFCSGAAKTNAPAGGCSEDDDSLDVGLRAGYDWQFGNWVVGAVGEVSFIDIQDSVSAFSTTPASYTMTREADWTGAVRLRGGYAFDRFLVYGTGGPSYISLDHSFDTTNTANTFTERGEDDGVWGYQLGFGGEAKVWGNMSIGLEYLYNKYEDDSYRVRASQGTAPATNPFILVNAQGTDFKRSDSDLEFSTVRATLSWRF